MFDLSAGLWALDFRHSSEFEALASGSRKLAPLVGVGDEGAHHLPIGAEGDDPQHARLPIGAQLGIGRT